MKEIDQYTDLLIKQHELDNAYEKSHHELYEKMLNIEKEMFDWVKTKAVKHKKTGAVIVKTEKGWLVANTSKHFDVSIIVPLDNIIDLTEQNHEHENQ